jgi:tRNA-N(6)-(isopentenyl)adenosine-37 thiotransferase enzyme MiaB
MKFHIKTYGCQMNERDSEALACLLEADGAVSTDSEEDADLIIFNTCSVRDQAERKAIGKIGFMKKIKARNPKLVVGCIGCMAQNYGDKLLKDLPVLDFVVGTDQIHRVPEIVKNILRTRRRTAATELDKIIRPELDGHHPGAVVAEVAVMRGCDQFCSYCIVPHTRGREKSRPIPAIVEEVKRLVDAGTREILLLGQNITAYGVAEARQDGTYTKDFSAFADLLAAVHEVPGLARIRFTSPHVHFMNDKFIQTIRDLPKVCKCFHVPLQSGSDRILKLMRRSYTAAEYLDCIHKIREGLPEVNFTTDVIVGFPTETEDDFNMTRQLMKDVVYDMAYIFRYSPRTGTKSARDYPDDVSEETKHLRNQILLEDLEAGAAERNARFKDTIQEILVEGVSKRNAERWTGRTMLNKVCNFLPVEGIKPGDLVNVRIKRTTANSLFGEIISE